MSQSRLQAGGTLQQDKLYLVRDADQRMAECLSAGEYCHILAPRQVGKSSLIQSVSRQLPSERFACVTIDLSSMGVEGSSEQWFKTLLFLILKETNNLSYMSIWDNGAKLLPTRRFFDCLAQLVRREFSKRFLLVILDEIDITINLQCRGDFFAEIRSIYNARSQDPSLSHLVFCLAGTATPLDLADSSTRTPYNIGQAIILDDFTFQQTMILVSEIANLPGSLDAWVRFIYEQTHGHPLMTQKICLDLAKDPNLSEKSTLLSDDEIRIRVAAACLPENFNCVNEFERLTDVSRVGHISEAEIKKQFVLYRDVLLAEGTSGPSVRSRPSDAAEMRLKIAGVIAARKKSDGIYLDIRNPIFARKYDLAWLDERDARPPFHDDMRQWAENQSNDYLQGGQKLIRLKEWASARGGLNPQEQIYLEACIGYEFEQRRRTAIYVSLLIISIAMTITWVYYNRNGKLYEENAEMKQTLTNANKLMVSYKNLTDRCEQERGNDKGRLTSCTVDLNNCKIDQVSCIEKQVREPKVIRPYAADVSCVNDLATCRNERRYIYFRYFDLSSRIRNSKPIPQKTTDWEGDQTVSILLRPLLERMQRLLFKALDTCYKGKVRKKFLQRLELIVDLSFDGRLILQSELKPAPNTQCNAQALLKEQSIKDEAQDIARLYKVTSDRRLSVVFSPSRR